MAGYSGRSLSEKLGIRTGMHIVIYHAPIGYEQTLGVLPSNVLISHTLQDNVPFIQFFTKNTSELTIWFPKLCQCIQKNGMIWISWPKKSAKIETDVSGNVIRAIGIANGMVDTKVCAVDDMWSGLKFVYRIKDR